MRDAVREGEELALVEVLLDEEGTGQFDTFLLKDREHLDLCVLDLGAEGVATGVHLLGQSVLELGQQTFRLVHLVHQQGRRVTRQGQSKQVGGRTRKVLE